MKNLIRLINTNKFNKTEKILLLLLTIVFIIDLILTIICTIEYKSSNGYSLLLVVILFAILLDQYIQMFSKKPRKYMSVFDFVAGLVFSYIPLFYISVFLLFTFPINLHMIAPFASIRPLFSLPSFILLVLYFNQILKGIEDKYSFKKTDYAKLLFLSIVTVLIYFFIWYKRNNKELKKIRQIEKSLSKTSSTKTT